MFHAQNPSEVIYPSRTSNVEHNEENEQQFTVRFYHGVSVVQMALDSFEEYDNGH